MKTIFTKKQQPIGYSFQTTCYYQFQIIVVCEGELYFAFPEKSGKATPQQMLVLPIGSSFRIYCQQSSYSGIGVVVRNGDARFRASARQFSLDPHLLALTHYLLAEIDNPHPIGEHRTMLVADLLLDHALELLQDKESQIPDESQYWAEKMRQAIERSIHTHQSVSECVKKLGMSYRQLSRHFTHTFQESPKHYQIRLKLEKSKQLLHSSNSSLSDVAFEMGFSSLQHFSTAFQRELGVSPKRYKKNTQ